MLNTKEGTTQLLEKRISRFIASPFVRYVTVGIATFAIEYTLFCIAIERMKLHYLLANGIVFSVVFWFNFLANRIWSFRSKIPLGKQLVQYSLLFIFNLVVPNIVVMYMLTRQIGIAPEFSKAMVMGMVVFWNYILYKNIIYK